MGAALDALAADVGTAIRTDGGAPQQHRSGGPDGRGSEADVLCAAVEAGFARAEERIIAGAGGGTTCAEVLERYVRANLAHADERRATMRALADIRALAGSVPGVAARFDAAEERAVGELEVVLALGQQLGEFGSFPVRAAAAGLRASIDAVPARLRREPDLDVAHLADDLVVLVARMVRTDQAAPGRLPRRRGRGRGR